jgi:hypothetical protein
MGATNTAQGYPRDLRKLLRGEHAEPTKPDDPNPERDAPICCRFSFRHHASSSQACTKVDALLVASGWNLAVS